MTDTASQGAASTAADQAKDKGAENDSQGSASVTIAQADFDAFKAQLAAAENDRDAAQAALLTANNDRDAAQAALLTANNGRDTAVARVAELEAKLAKQTAATKTARVEQKATSPKLRKIGPLADGKQLETAALGDRLAIGELELAFSDGKKEIKGLPPLGIHGQAWQAWSGRWRLTVPVIVKGPGPNEPPYVITGLGLFDSDDNQVAYSELPEPMEIKPGSTVDLRGSILF